MRMSMDSELQLGFQAVATAIKQRQVALVSGTTIKTVNGDSLLGGGDVVLPTYANTTSTTTVFFSNHASKMWTVNTVGAYIEGSRVRIIDTTDNTRWMEGTIHTIVDDTVIAVNVDTASVTVGSSSSWKFSIAGLPATSNVVIAETEPVVAAGASTLWIETLPNGNISCWIKTGE